jgi:hypothetical protein
MKLDSKIAIFVICLDILFLIWYWRGLPNALYWKYMKWRYAPRIKIEFFHVHRKPLTKKQIDKLRQAAENFKNDPNYYAIWDAELDDEFPIKEGEQ